MSREIILGLADGDVDEHSSLFYRFIRRLGENVGKFKPEWMEELGGSHIPGNGSATENEDDDEKEEDDPMQEQLATVEPRGWMIRAVLTVLGQMCKTGPQGGLPPIQAICRAMRVMEQNDKCPKTDEAWMLYFLKVFHREQKKYLLESLGEGGKGELRRRLLKALRQSGTRSLDDIHYGPMSATIRGVDALMVAGSIGKREAGGNSKNYDAAMPMVGQLKEMVQDVLDLFPEHAPSFPNWMAIASVVFAIGFSPSKTSVTYVDVDEDRNKGLVADDDLDGSCGHGDWQASHADVSQVRALVQETIAALDGEPFPDGLHGRTFVEFLLFADRAGVNRVTQEEYANRTGVSDGTVAYRRDSIFRALRENDLDLFDDIAICEAFKQMEAAYLDRHLEIFGA